MAETQQRWPAVGAAVSARMKEMALSQADLTRESGVSEFTVRKVMRGESGNYRPDRLAKISRALGWAGDGIDQMLKGNTPELAPSDDERPATSAEVRQIADEVFDIRERIDRLALLVEQNIGTIRTKKAQAPAGAGPRRTSARDS